MVEFVVRFLPLGGSNLPQRCLHFRRPRRSYRDVNDVNFLRQKSISAMAGIQQKPEKDVHEYSLLPLVHDIIKW